jgi:hypothetical protein
VPLRRTLSPQKSPPLQTPPSVPPQTPPSCVGAAPSPQFHCSGGTWIAVGEVQVEGELTIPITNPVQVVGNLSIAGDLIFSGISGSVGVVNGCISIGGSVIVNLSEEEVKQLVSSRVSPLITQSPSSSSKPCSTSLNELGVRVNLAKNSCKKITAKVDSSSTPNSLSVLFQIDSSGCNSRWIILGCVLGGVFVIVLIVILVVTFNDRAKATVRPFWVRKQALKKG